MKFSVKDIFCKCEQIRSGDFVTFPKEDLKEITYFSLCEVNERYIQNRISRQRNNVLNLV